MSLTQKVVLVVALLLVIVSAIPLASLALAALPSLSTDAAVVFLAVAGAFGFGFVLSVPKER